MGVNVLLSTSGTGARLGELTEHTNKCLVRVGTKAVISHIIEGYPSDTTFYIMLGHKGELVRQYLTLAHPTLRVVYLDRELRTGENLGLVGAMKAQWGLIPMSAPLIFHASDTITEVPPEILHGHTSAVLGCATVEDVSMYRMDRGLGGLLTRVMDKGEQVHSTDFAHIGVVRFQDTGSLLNALHNVDAFGCDTHLVNMLRAWGETFRLVKTPLWFDTGNMSKLEAARKHFAVEDFVLLEKVDQAVYMVGNRVIKFFAEPLQVEDRAARAEHLWGAIPKLVQPVLHNFFAYEKAEGELARDVMQAEKFKRFLNWADALLWREFAVSCKEFSRLTYEFYHDKTLSRVAKFYEKTGLKDAEDMVNGVRLPSLEALLDMVPWSGFASLNHPCKGMHGDLHFSNILVNGDRGSTAPFVLLDWRENFAGNLEYGDAYYDLAKLLHGLIVSHDMVEKDQYSVQISEEPSMYRVVTFDIMRHHRHVECEKALKDWCGDKEWSWVQVQTICALIFLNIAALHHHPYDKFLYFLGKKMLNDTLE